jgi:hypothetical protein
MTTAGEGSTLTALDLLFGPDSDAAETLAGAIMSLRRDQGLGRVLGHLPQTTREAVVREAAAAAAALLKVDLIDVLVRGWREHRVIVSAARRTLAAPASTELVSMIAHQITLDQQPSLSVLVDGQRVATLQLGLSVVFDVNALLLLISRGRLAAIRSGRSEITATLAIQGTDLLVRRAHLELPGVVPLRWEIELLPAGEYPAAQDPPGDRPAAQDPPGDRPAAQDPPGDRPAAQDPPGDNQRSQPGGAEHPGGGHQGSQYPPGTDAPPAPWWQRTGSVRPPAYVAGPR